MTWIKFRTARRALLFAASVVSAILIAAPMHGQQGNVATLPPASGATQPPAKDTSGPTGQPGLYVQDSTGWHLLAQNMQYKAKVKRGFVSGLTYGAVAAPMVVEYPGVHAAVQISMTQPQICAYRLMVPGTPLLVRLTPKKQKRELDSGSLRAVPLVGQTHEAKASDSSLIPTKTLPSTTCVTLLQPEQPLVPGEYAVMFGAQNVAIMDFGVTDSTVATK